MNSTTKFNMTKGAIALAAAAGLAFGGSAAAIAAVGTPTASHAVVSGGSDSPHGRYADSVITGQATPGSTLTAVAPEWLVVKGASVLGYQWSVDGVDVAGATGETFDLTGVAPGSVVGLTLTIGLADGSTKVRTSQKVVTGLFVIAGAPVVSASGSEVGATLTVDPAAAGWTPAPAKYLVVWLRDGAYLARGDVYTSTADDAGRSITAKVVAFLDGYRPASAESAPVVLAAPVAPEPAPPAEPVPADPAPAPEVTPGDDQHKHDIGECDDDHDGWADGDRDRDGRVDSNGAWWGGPSGWGGSGDHGGGDDRGGDDRGDRGGHDRSDRH